MTHKKNLLCKLTIVIPTYNRQDYAIRNMNFWSKREPNIIVIDGSKNSIPSKTIKNFGSNVKYIHDAAPILRRLDRARSLIKTEYVSLLGDDEFFLSDGLLASIKELDSDLSLVACMGRALGFVHYKKNLIKGFFVYSDFKNYSVADDKPSMRMQSHMNQYAPSTIYSVVRTPIWQAAFEASTLYEFPVNGIAELQFELAVSYFGKSKIIPALHWLRSFEEKPIRESLVKDKSLDARNKFNDFWLSKEKSFLRGEFIQVTSKVLAEYNNRDINEVALEVKQAMDLYSIASTQKYLSSKITISRVLLNSLPIPLANLIRIFKYEFQNLFTNTFTLSSCAQRLSETGVKVNFCELSEIEKIILKFHLNRK